MRQKLVYLPKGSTWIDFWTGESYNGGQYIIKESPLNICPIFVKADSIIPMSIEQNYIGEKESDELILNLYLSEEENEFKYIHYNDDGESFEYRNGIYNEYEIIVSNKESIDIKFIINKNNYIKKYSKVKFIINNLKTNKKITLNGKEVSLNNNSIEMNI